MPGDLASLSTALYYIAPGLSSCVEDVFHLDFGKLVTETGRRALTCASLVLTKELNPSLLVVRREGALPDVLYSAPD
jgi:hypothetical protein